MHAKVTIGSESLLHGLRARHATSLSSVLVQDLMADLPSQKPADFDASGRKLLHKTAQLIQTARGHALAVYADSQHNCHFYASSALQGLATDAAATQFFCQQLVQQLHPGQMFIPTFIEVLPDEKPLPYQQNTGARRRTWKDRVTTLQALVRTMRTDHPDRAFCWYVEGGKDLHTYSGAGPRIDNIFDHPGWDQSVQQRIRGAGVPVMHNVRTATAEAARPAARRKRPAQQAPNEDIDSRPAPRQRRKLQPTNVIPPGSSEWYRRKLSADPAAYVVPLVAGAWALPDYNLHSEKMSMHRPVQVAYALC